MRHAHLDMYLMTQPSPWPLAFNSRLAASDATSTKHATLARLWRYGGAGIG